MQRGGMVSTHCMSLWYVLSASCLEAGMAWKKAVPLLVDVCEPCGVPQ